jgi:hypothetical protein
VLRSLGGAIGVRSVRDYSPAQGRAESAVEVAKMAAVERRDAARTEFERINAIPAQKRAEPLFRLRARDPLLFDRVLNEFAYELKG